MVPLYMIRVAPPPLGLLRLYMILTEERNLSVRKSNFCTEILIKLRPLAIARTCVICAFYHCHTSMFYNTSALPMGFPAWLNCTYWGKYSIVSHEECICTYQSEHHGMMFPWCHCQDDVIYDVTAKMTSWETSSMTSLVIWGYPWHQRQWFIQQQS